MSQLEIYIKDPKSGCLIPFRVSIQGTTSNPELVIKITARDADGQERSAELLNSVADEFEKVSVSHVAQQCKHPKNPHQRITDCVRIDLLTH